ncbi:MAG: CRISPR-associated RAMP protein, partial [Chloroflexi bacterium]
MLTKKFEKRYVFKGNLVLQTGLHIGGRDTVFSPSEHPVIRTPDGQPFIPGSSFKGAFRSTVEKLAPNIAGIWSCGLTDEGNENGCIGPQGEAQRKFNETRDPKWSDDELLTQLEGKLCHTCRLFGSPYAASKITFADLYPTEKDIDGVIQIRDGVAIDRDSERAADGLLFEYEVVAPSLSFGLEILLEDPTDVDLGLTCLGLSEFMSGFGYLGGKRSRGLGQTKLENLQIYSLDLTDESTR